MIFFAGGTIFNLVLEVEGKKFNAAVIEKTGIGRFVGFVCDRGGLNQYNLADTNKQIEYNVEVFKQPKDKEQ